MKRNKPQLHAGKLGGVGRSVWHTNHAGTHYWCPLFGDRNPEELLSEAESVIADLQRNHPGLKRGDSTSSSLRDKRRVVRAFIKVLNDANAADPRTIGSLVFDRRTCNKRLAAQSTVLVYPDRVLDTYTVGLLGVINGICAALTGRLVAATRSGRCSDSKPYGDVRFVEFNPRKPRKGKS